jgi:oxygen-independent coproporphyrinogen-3 oxidase
VGPSARLSLYVHIPFCAKKCRYCDFNSIAGNDRLIDRFIDALAREWDLAQTAYNLRDASFSTLFFGGGTPSLFSLGQWQKINDRLISRLRFSPDYEWSVECNPESFSAEKARAWKESGVNRLTFGIQSFNDRELRVLGRIHNARKAMDVLSSLVLSRFASIGVDLMYGLPGQTLGSLKQSLDFVFTQTPVDHLSAYELTLSDATALGRHKKLLPLPSDDDIVEMNNIIVTRAAKHDFTRYEISNYAKPGKQCRHNHAYWRHGPYLGLGPSAHSYLPPMRFSNVKDLQTYCATLEKGDLPKNFIETIDRETLAREMIFLGLRTSPGIDEEKYLLHTGDVFNSGERKRLLTGFLQQERMTYCKPFWSLTRQGMLFADGIARELIK